MCGHFNWERERPSVDKDKSLVWLCSLGLTEEVESLMTAAQDQALNTRYHQRNIMRQPIERKCRIGCKAKHSLLGTTTHVGSRPTLEVASNRLCPWSSNFQLPASPHPSSLHPSEVWPSHSPSALQLVQGDFLTWQIILHSYYVSCPSKPGYPNCYYQISLIIQTIQFFIVSWSPCYPFTDRSIDSS